MAWQNKFLENFVSDMAPGLSPENAAALEKNYVEILNIIAKQNKINIDKAMDMTYSEGIKQYYQQTIGSKKDERLGSNALYAATDRVTKMNTANVNQKNGYIEYITTFTLNPHKLSVDTTSFDKWVKNARESGISRPLLREKFETPTQFEASSTKDFILGLVYYEGIISLPKWFHTKVYKRHNTEEATRGEVWDQRHSIRPHGTMTLYRNPFLKKHIKNWQVYFDGKNNYFSVRGRYMNNLMKIIEE